MEVGGWRLEAGSVGFLWGTSWQTADVDAAAPPTPRAARWDLALPIVVCTLVAGAARWWVHRDLHASDPTLLSPVLDDAYYLEVAERIGRGDSFDSFLAHLHPWMATRLSMWSALTVATLGGMNAVLGALTSGIVAWAAGVTAGRRAAYAAGGLHALAGVFLFHDVLPGQEAAIGLAAAVTILCGTALVVGRRPYAIRLAALGLGVAIGVATLGRGTSLALLACAIPGWLRRPRTAAGVRLCAVLCAAGLALVLLAGAGWNQHVGGPFSPFPWSGGVNAYLTNGPDARATVSMTAGELGSDPWAIERNALDVASAAEGRRVNTRDASSWWLSRTLETSGDVSEIASHGLRKAALFWTSDGRGSNHSASAEREFATLLRLLPVSGWWILALGAGAWWLVRRERPVASVAALAVVGTWAGLTVFFPVDRYRLPALVASCVLVGLAAASRPDWRRLVQAALVVTACGALAWVPVRPRDDAIGHVSVALALVRLDAPPPDVEERLARALAADTTCGPALELLGRLRIGSGQPAEAYDLFVRAAQDRRTRFSAQVAALGALLELRRLDEARSVALGLLRENDHDVVLLAQAALVAAAAGDMGDPQQYLVRARALDPLHPAVLAAQRQLR